VGPKNFVGIFIEVHVEEEREGSTSAQNPLALGDNMLSSENQVPFSSPSMMWTQFCLPRMKKKWMNLGNGTEQDLS